MYFVSIMPQVPGRIEKLITEKQFYAAVQLHVQSTLMLEREGLQTVGLCHFIYPRNHFSFVLNREILGKTFN